MKLIVALFVLIGLSIAQTGSKTAHVTINKILADPKDVSTIDGVIHAYYDIVSISRGQPRQWDRDHTLYIEDMRFVAMNVDKQGNPVPVIMSHQEFVDRSDPRMARGFFEKEIHRASERFGNVAHVWSTYESRDTVDGPVTARGINSLELFWDGKRWWISHSIWDEERPGNPLPKQYLP
jgi:hypothetical protein